MKISILNKIMALALISATLSSLTACSNEEEETMGELETKIVSEIIEITNASGETVTDENGEAKTEVVTEVVMVTTSPAVEKETPEETTKKKESFIESLFSKDDDKETNEEVATKKEETATTAAVKETTTGKEEKTTKKSTTTSTTKKTTTTKPTTTKVPATTTTTKPAETTTVKKVDESRVILPAIDKALVVRSGEKISYYSPAQNVNLVQWVVYYNGEEVWRSPMLDGGDSCEWDIRADLGVGVFETEVVAEVYKASTGKFATSSTYNTITYKVRA